MSSRARAGASTGRWLVGVVQLLVPIAGCGGTDIVARLHSQCSALDGACDDAGDAADDASDASTEDTGTEDAGDTGAGDADAAPDAGPPACGARSCGALATSDSWCASNGTAVQTGDSCAAEDAAISWRHALCSCSDLVSMSPFTADSFMGTLQLPVADAATIGVNADLALSGSGSIDGELHVMGRRVLSPNVKVDALVPVSVPPCACEPQRLLDIEALVLAHKRNHDNAREGLSETALDGFTGAKELTLPCGRYYFTRFKSEDSLTIHTRGNVAIFVEGNIELNDALRILTDDDSGQVSLFVAGEARVSGALALSGDPSAKSRVNLYLQGVGTLELGGSAEIVGQLYAPRAELVNRGIVQLYGSLFVERAGFSAELHIHYDTSAATPVQCTVSP